VEHKPIAKYNSLFRHPSTIFKCEFSIADFALEIINVLAELTDGIQRRIVLEGKTADLRNVGDKACAQAEMKSELLITISITAYNV
jgi:hypothetical protein